MIPDFKTFIKESIWSDMQDRGTGEIKKKEDESNLSQLKPIDLGGSILWADRDLDVHGNDLFTVNEIQKIIKGSEWRLPTVEEAKELNGVHGYYETDGWSFGEDDNILYFTKRKYTDKDPGNTYVGWTSNIFFEGKRVNVFMLEDEHLNEDIIYSASVEQKYNARLVKDLPKS